MGEAFLDYKKGGTGFNINGIIADYYVSAGTTVNAGDFVDFVNGVAGQTNYGTSTDTPLVESTNYGYTVSATKIADNKVFVAHGSSNSTSGGYVYGIICTVEGATITYGTDTKLYGSSGTGYVISATTLSSGNVFIIFSYGSSNYLYGMLCTVSGTTITVAQKTGIKNVSAGVSMRTIALEDNKAFVIYNNGSSKYGLICTMTDTTISIGTAYTLYNNTYTDYSKSLTVLPNGNVFVAYGYDSSNYLHAMVCSVSGTTITAGTDTALSTETNSGYTISAVTLPNGNVFIAHSYGSSYYLYVMVCTISGTTITAGSDYSSSTASNAGYKISALSLTGGRVFVAHSYKSSYYLYGNGYVTSGTRVISGTDVDLSNSYAETGFATSLVELGNGSVFAAHSYSSSYHLYARIFGLDVRTPTTSIVLPNYETQVRTATSVSCKGVAKIGGIGGDNTGHNELVSVYQPDTNLLVNGDFSNELDGWIVPDFNPVRVESSVVDNQLKLECVEDLPNNSWNYICRDIPFSTGHIYYVCGNYNFVSWTNTDTESSHLSLLLHNSFKHITPSNIGYWQSFSHRGQIEAETSIFGFSIGLMSAHAGSIVYVDDLKFYDLTAIYGEGNEPTQEWCDNNL